MERIHALPFVKIALLKDDTIIEKRQHNHILQYGPLYIKAAYRYERPEEPIAKLGPLVRNRQTYHD